MGVKTFAAISVASYELSMKIFEFSGKDKMKTIDFIRHSIDIGSDTYDSGKISFEHMDEICRVLREFWEIAKGYHVDAYKAYGTTALRETKNRVVVLDQIKARTGVEINVLSNSEQRFLDYKSIASTGSLFDGTIKSGTAVVDIGGGSIQISLFDKDSLVTTQNIQIGVLRMREQLSKLKLNSARYEEVANELVASQLSLFKKLFLRDRKVTNLVVVDDYLSDLIGRKKPELRSVMDRPSFDGFYEKFHNHTDLEMSSQLDMDEEKIPLLYLSALLVKNMTEILDVENINIPGVSLCDGIAYEYGEKNHLIVAKHDFEQDIIACAQNISDRYKGSKKQAETITKIAFSIFDSMKKENGLGKREKLLLQIAILLHDCGKYINMANAGECSYNIIMATEIIGLSHMEREMVANIVRFSLGDLPGFDEMTILMDLDIKTYLNIAKLTAILQVARALAKSHKQKYKAVRSSLSDEKLDIFLSSASDITLEIGFIEKHLNFFEEVYSIRPVIHCVTSRS